MNILSDLDRCVFIECNRNALLNHIKELTDDEMMIQYIKEDASDANILSLIMYGKVLKENEDDIFIEQELLNQYMTILEQNNIIDDKESLLEGTPLKIATTHSDDLQRNMTFASNTAEYAKEQLYKLRKVGVSEDSYIMKYYKKMQYNMEDAYDKLKDHQAYGRYKDVETTVKYSVPEWFKTNAGMATGAVGITLLIATAAMIGYKIYKRYFTVAGKTCAGKSGYNKEVCITNVKIKAIEETIKTYKDNIKSCKLTKDPNKCKERINKLIQKSQSKINKLKKKKMR